jgi:ribosomal protein L24
VFVEVNSESDARTFALSIVELNPNAIRLVPAEELLSVLYIKNPFSFDGRNWAKLTGRGTEWSVYRGDIGMVVTQNGVKTVVVIPRIKTSESIDMPRPQPSLFPAQVLINLFGDGCISSSSSDGSFTFKRKRFTKEGFLRHKLSEVDVYRPADDLPTEFELEIFKECSMMDDKVLNDTVSRLARIKIVLHDRVVVVEGDFKGLVGTVVERGDNEVAVDVETQDQIERVNLSAVRVAFRLGDQVQIKQGPHSGRIGWIVDVQDLTVTVINVELSLEVIMNSCNVHFVDKDFTGIHQEERHWIL